MLDVFYNNQRKVNTSIVKYKKTNTQVIFFLQFFTKEKFCQQVGPK